MAETDISQTILDLVKRLVDEDGFPLEVEASSRVFDVEVGCLYRTRRDLTVFDLSQEDGAICLATRDNGYVIEKESLVEVCWIGIGDPGWGGFFDQVMVIRRHPREQVLFVAEGISHDLEIVPPLEQLALQAPEETG